MRLPNAAHEARPWRIREIAPDFTLEDVWALPVHGDAGDFETLVEVMATLDPTRTPSPASRLLFDLRFLLGRWFGWDDPATHRSIPDEIETTLTDRLPDDLRRTVTDLELGSEMLENLGVHFAPIYRTGVECAAEVSNRTVHGVIHLAWAAQGDGRYQGQMAIYVKPRGAFGKAYMGLIKPFRYWVVYPALLRQIEHAWNARRKYLEAAAQLPVSPGVTGGAA